jgi:hypothetical protein
MRPTGTGRNAERRLGNQQQNGAVQMEAIENATIETLKSSYANAAATACLALGHGKSHRNEAEAKRYAEELQARGVEPLEYFDAAEMGTFNGSGSV